MLNSVFRGRIKSVFIGVSEILAAFLLVFVVSFLIFRTPFVSKDFKRQFILDAHTQTDSSSDGHLHYNPARKYVFVNSTYADFLEAARPDSKVLEHLTFGQKLNVIGWDTSRKFVNVSIDGGSKGFVATANLVAEEPSGNTDTSKIPDETSQLWRRRFLKYLAFPSTTEQELVIDGVTSDSGLDLSLSKFFRVLRRSSSKSKFNLSKPRPFFAIILNRFDGTGSLLYPNIAEFVAGLKSANGGAGFFVSHDATKQLDNSSLKLPADTSVILKNARDLPFKVGGTHHESVKYVLGSLKIKCSGLECELRFDNLPGIGDEISSISILIPEVNSSLNPSITLVKDESTRQDIIAFIDLDSDANDDVAVRVKSFSDESISSRVVFVAFKDSSGWQLRYIQNSNPGMSDQPVVSVEPGVYEKPFVVSVTSVKKRGVVYTTDGTEPTCSSSSDDNERVQEADILVDKSMTVKIQSCEGSENSRSVLAASYLISADSK